MLKPEQQDLEVFVDGIFNIVEAQKWVAECYFADGSVEGACPPLKALLHIMAYGHYNGKDVNDPDIRNMFTHNYLVNSDWYRERLLNKQLSDIALWQKHVRYLRNYLEKMTPLDPSEAAEIQEKMKMAEENLKYMKSTDYLKSLEGFTGLDTFVK